MMKVNCIWQIPALLGEGPLWVDQENALYWVDLLSRKVHRFTLSTEARDSWAFDEPITSLAQRQNGGFVGTVPDGFVFVDFNTGSVEPVVQVEANLPGNRFNDGKVDSNGRYWAGTMDRNGRNATGSLYRLDPDRTVHQMDSPYIISNGPTFSRDGRTLYHTDSKAKTIFAFDLRADGTIGRKRPFIQLNDPAEGSPDGMTVDSENCLWLAHFGGSRLTRYSSSGDVLQVVPLPVPNVTSCTFGGPNLDTLYITTATAGLSPAEQEEYPLAGSLFTYQPDVSGLPTARFSG